MADERKFPTLMVRVPVIHYYDVEIDLNDHAWENEDGTNDADTIDVAELCEDWESWPSEPADVTIGDLMVPEPGTPIELPGRIWYSEVARDFLGDGNFIVYGDVEGARRYDTVNEAIRAHAVMPDPTLPIEPRNES